ncbi:MAG: Fe-S cluster assembly protein SufD [Planctomycetota bacterium]|nr:Fe-S cluster assembly protein SufD [Planctomycetota bacterium]MDA1180290.1 Fe-S cluster assembly protein SufD [Planctomycetota bacterium]
MVASGVQTGFSQENFAAFLLERSEPNWLTDLRRDFWEEFQRRSMPTRAQEEWMRTDIRLLHLGQQEWPTTSVAQTELPSAALSTGVELAGQTVTLNGRTQSHALVARWREQGVIFGPLESIVQEHPELVRKYLLNRAVDPRYDKFSALHAACWGCGTILFVPRHVCIDAPFHTMSILSDGGVDLGHTLIVLEDGAEASVLVETASCQPHDKGFHCGATEIIQGAGSRLRFVGLQDWGSGVWHLAHQKAVLSKDASLQWTIGALGARLAKVNQHVELVGPGAECQVNGVMFTEGKQHLSYHTLQHHMAPSCRSDFLYKAALQDTSRTVWRGMIKVDQGAQKTDGYQRNDNLLLSAKARADAIPGLEIEADDVRCTHGSTTGRVDEEPIFYACCRGFTRKEAIRMIVTGFFQQVFDRITIDSVRDALGRSIARRVREYE